MSRTTTREIVKVCTELAKLDRRGKEEILHYLQEDLKKSPCVPLITSGGGDQSTATYEKGTEK